jgi:hypothetical protein
MLVVVAMALALVLVGCSGGGGGRIDIARSGRISPSDIQLADGSFADIVRVRATRDGFITVAMNRGGSDPVFDPYIQVFEGSASTFADLQRLFNLGLLIDSDDDSGSGVNAALDFLADDNQVYSIVLNTSGPNDFGTYNYRIEEVSGPQVVSAGDSGDKAAADPQAKFRK